MAQISTRFIQNNAVNEQKLLIPNNAAIRSRTADDDGDFAILKVDVTNKIQLLNQTQISVAPTEANDIATKTYVDTAVSGITGDTYQKFDVTLSSGDLVAGYVDLLHVIKSQSLDLVVSGLVFIEDTDYTVSLTGGAGGNTRVSFTGMAPLLIAGDVVSFKYVR